MNAANPATGHDHFRRALVIAALIAAVLNFIAFYPGLLHHDAWAYFDASRKGNWTNWQPPLLGYLWYPLRAIHDGPQPMLVLFVAAYWSGYVLIADSLRHEGRALAIWIFLTAFFPLALNFNGQLVKDVSMGVCLLIGAGIAAGLITGRIHWRAVAVALMWFFIAAGAFMRANSLFGLPPLLDLAGRATSTRWVAMHWINRSIIVLIVSAAVAPAHLFLDRNVFRVEDIKPMSQLQVFDLGGMTHFSGVDRFQGYFGPNFVERNETCYTPRHWDVYGWMVGGRGCPEVYNDMKSDFGWPLTKLWLEGIAANPVAYLQHRFAHANRFFQFLCEDCKEPIFTGWQSTNQKEFTFEPTFLFHAIDWAAQTIHNTPFGPPYVWLLIALAWAWASFGIPNERTRAIIFALSASGAMYALGFFIIGIAHEYRYIHWTMLCALTATPVIVARVFVRTDAPRFYRVFPLLMIVGVIVFREVMVRFVL